MAALATTSSDYLDLLVDICHTPILTGRGFFMVGSESVVELVIVATESLVLFITHGLWSLGEPANVAAIARKGWVSIWICTIHESAG